MRWIRILIRLPFVVVLNSLSLLRFGIASGLHRLFRLFSSDGVFVKISLEDGLPLGRDRRGLARYFDNSTTFLQLRRDLKRVAAAPDVEGIILETKGTNLGRARAADFADLLEDARNQGKRVVATLDMAMTGEYMLATAADDVVLTPAGRLYTFGARIEQLYFTPVLRKLGLTAQFVHLGPFKTAYNRFVRDEPSAGDAAMTAELREKIDHVTVRTIAERRGVDSSVVRELFAHAPVDARWARNKGLIDGEVFAQDLTRFVEVGDELRHKPDERDVSPKVTTVRGWIEDQPKPLRWRTLEGKTHRIAVIDLSGMIVMPRTNVPGASQTIDPDEVLPVLSSLRRSSYDGVLLHISSPGGSALASDIIWNAIDELRAEIPVVAYCSDVAASGGYYLACGADQIVCRPESIVGSIGVITGKISAEGALQKLGVERAVYHESHAPAKMLSLTESLSEDELRSVRDEAREFYRRFLHRVGVARSLSKRRLHRYARGRVYLGEAALQRGLVDGLGGFEEAVSRLEGLIEAPAGTAKLRFVSVGRTSLADAIRGQLVPSFGSTAEAVLGSEVPRVAQTLAVRALLQRESTLALSSVEGI